MALNKLEEIAESYEKIIRSNNVGTDSIHYTDTIRDWYGAYCDNNWEKYNSLTTEIINQLKSIIEKKQIQLPLFTYGEVPTPIVISYYIEVVYASILM